MPHELGHQNQMLGYKAPEFSEVTNNISALAVQRAFGLPSILLAKGDDGLDTWAILLNKLNTPQAKIELSTCMNASLYLNSSDLHWVTTSGKR